MGVKGLHARLKAHCNQVDALVDYKGLCVGVDASGWLHRAYNAALAEGIQDEAALSSYVTRFFTNYTGALRASDVRVSLVWDGTRPAAKCVRPRSESGNGAYAFADAAWLAAEDAGATCVLAEGEADAHLVALARSGTVCCVLTDDSDLVALGCPRTLFKAKLLRPKRRYTLFGDEFELLSLGASPGPFLGWSHERFVAFCVACGCDYVENVPRVGPARALALCTKHETTEGILEALLAEPGCPTDYEERFRAAMDIFRRNE